MPSMTDLGGTFGALDTDSLQMALVSYKCMSRVYEHSFKKHVFNSWWLAGVLGAPGGGGAETSEDLGRSPVVS